MSLTRFTADPWAVDPFLGGSFRQMQRDMNRLMSDFWDQQSSSGPVARTFAEGGAAAFSPRIDVHESEKAIELTADLPGIPKNNVKIDARDNVLTLSGEAAAEGERREGTTHICERYRGKFSRSVALPTSADLEHVQAKFDNGVLHVVVPKKPETQGGRRITIQ